MKATLISGLILLLAYGLYNLGYRQGRQLEWNEIWSNVQIENGRFVLTGRVEFKPVLQINAIPRELKLR